MSKPIKVVLIEDDLEWLHSIQTIIKAENDIELVGYGSTEEDTLRLAKDIDEVDIFLVDINLTGAKLDGIHAAYELQKLQSESDKKWKVVMLTCLGDKDVIIKAFTAGAVNYILKKDVHNIANIIRSTYAGNFTAIEAMLEDYRDLKYEQQLTNLTQSERIVFDMMEKGYSRQSIQKQLSKSNNTIKNQIQSIFKKLSVKNIKDAIEKAKSGGLEK
ncbi:DNA-binding response regulator [Priestia megaterium]|uniref:DNA-binding response regulator n=1 Tax=Priestia megaterium TaxID=1404 RepID=UPI001F3659BC|nr:response regulator transcription factor [Priestia megaterium]MCF8890706.1 response regulator transcription factor [Priestia megaterium]